MPAGTGLPIMVQRGCAQMPVIAGVVMPASPVLIPEVGRGRERDAVQTVGACRRVARLLQDAGPDLLVVVLPPEGDTCRVWTAPSDTVPRSFERYDTAELNTVDRLDAGVATLLGGSAAGVTCAERPFDEIPEPALLPLYFLSRTATLPLALISPPAIDLPSAALTGVALAGAMSAAGRRAAVVAVGELSSRLFRGAPGGYSPTAAGFDQTLVELLERGDHAGVLSLSSSARQDAAETLLPQLATVLGALGEEFTVDLLSYGGPYGAGYLVGFLNPAPSAGVSRRQLPVNI